jgi:hypothetical protein
MPYLNAERLPIVDINKTEKLRLLNADVALQPSAQKLPMLAFAILRIASLHKGYTALLR